MCQYDEHVAHDRHRIVGTAIFDEAESHLIKGRNDGKCL
jgi:hypothetical protein